MYIFEDETHLDAEVMSVFVFLLATITQVLISTFIGNTALQGMAHEGSDYGYPSVLHCLPARI